MTNDHAEINHLMHQGVLAIQRNQFPQALHFFDLVITKEPTFAEAWNKRAMTYYLMENYHSMI